MNHRVGDIVRVKSREWYDANKDADGLVPCGDLIFTPDAAELCGTEQEIAEIPFNESYIFAGQDESKDMAFNDAMLEELKHCAVVAPVCTNPVDGGCDGFEYPPTTVKAFVANPQQFLDTTCRHCGQGGVCTNTAVLRQLGIGEQP
jgi:hypothetical protein